MKGVITPSLVFVESLSACGEGEGYWRKEIGLILGIV
jgi:hypothetical protein